MTTALEPYYIFHFRAGMLKETVQAASEREALSSRFDVPLSALKTRADGKPMVQFGMQGSTPETTVVFHEYVATSVAEWRERNGLTKATA